MTWEGLNRRQFPRASFPCLVKIFSNWTTVEPVLTHTENIGMGGICVVLRKSLEKLTLVRIEIDLMDGEDHIVCQAKVLWNVRRKAMDINKPFYYDIGIEYVDISNKGRQRLESVVAQIVKKESKGCL